MALAETVTGKHLPHRIPQDRPKPDRVVRPLALVNEYAELANPRSYCGDRQNIEIAIFHFRQTMHATRCFKAQKGAGWIY